MVAQQKLSKYGSIVLLLFAAVMLFLAQSAYWVNHTVFNQATFTQITSTALQKETSRGAIATAVVDRALADRPVLQRTVGPRIESFTSGLLGSDLGTQAVTAISSKTYAYVTAQNRQDIKIDLEGAKTALAGMVAIAQNFGRGENLALVEEKIPNEIILVESDSFPNLSGTVQLMLWMGPLFWLLSIGGFVWYVYISRALYAKRVYVVGLTIVIVAVLGLLTMPFVPPPISAAVPNIALRPVVENVTMGFLQPFTVQMYWMLGVTLVALLIFNQRFNILALIRALEARLAKDTTKKGST